MLAGIARRLLSGATCAARALVRAPQTDGAMHRRAPLLRALGCVAALTLGSAAECVTEEERARLLWQSAGGADAQMDDLRRLGVGEVLHVAAHSGGLLVRDPPDATEINTLLTALNATSGLTGADAWPDPAAADAASLASFTRTTTVMNIYCRLCARNVPAATDAVIALAGVGALPSGSGAGPSGAPAPEPDKGVEAQRLMRSASALYNFNFARELARVDPNAIVLTRDQLKLNRLTFKQLSNAAYAVPKGLESSEKWLTYDPTQNRMREHEAETTLHRNGLVLSTIYRVLLTGTATADIILYSSTLANSRQHAT